MEKRFCLNVTLVDNKSSSPMPIIGLYIAGGTLVCLLFMICDIFHGLCRKKLWIPCRFFSLNSVTLTLLAIASKLPVDLTTPMPSAHEQLSKLSGTVLICISMSLFSLSFSTQSESERLSNLISLSIFVITVVVNVCMQMVTGVIFLFIVEHVIIMSCMLLLLSVTWSMFYLYFPWDIISSSFRIGDELKKIDSQNSASKSMIHRLKSVFLSNYENNPELCFLRRPSCYGMYMIAVLCALVLSQAALRSLVLKEVEFRCGVSDYKWSIWMVVVTQILTVLVGGIVIVFRWIVSHRIISQQMTMETDTCFIALSWVLSTLKKLQTTSFFKISRRGFMFIIQIIARNINSIVRIVTIFTIALASPLSLIWDVLFLMIEILKANYGVERNGEDRAHMSMSQWIQRTFEEDIKKCMEKGKKDSPTHLIQLLSKTPPSQEPLTNKFSTILTGRKVSCLLIVVFIRTIIISLPDGLVASLILTFDEAFEVIYFIDKEMNANRRSCSLAKELWMTRESRCHWFHGRFIKPSLKKFHSKVLKKSMDGRFQSQPQLQMDLSRALGIIGELKATNEEISCYFFEDDKAAGNEIDMVYEFIIGEVSRRKKYASIDELHGHIVQLFVDMLHFFISQLPLAIFKHLVESPIKECEERTRLVLKLLCKFEPFEDKVHWIFPDGAGITTLTAPDEVSPIDTQVHHSLSHGIDISSLINTQVSTIDNQRIEQVERNADGNVASQLIEEHEIQELV